MANRKFEQAFVNFARASFGQRPLKGAKTVYIDHHPDFDEYKVHLGKGSSGYYTNDKQDAIDTARAEHGKDAALRHRSKRYGPDPD